MYNEKKQCLEEKLLSTTDFFEKMEIEDQLFALKVEYGLADAPDYDYNNPECIGCGS